MNNRLQMPKTVHFSTYGLMLFFVLLPFEYPLAQYSVGSVLKYVGILTMGLAALDVMLVQGFRIYKHYRIAAILIWIIYVFFSVLWSIDTDRFSYYASMYINHALMFFMVSLVKYQTNELELVKKACVAGGVLLVLYMTFIPGAVVYSFWQHRLTLAALDGSELLDQNYLAALLLMPFTFVFYDLISIKKTVWKKILGVVFCFGCFYYIMTTGSRSGLIAACVVMALILKQNARKHLLYVILAGLALLLFVPMIVTYLPAEIIVRYSLSGMTGQAVESSERLKLWEIALDSVRGIRTLVGYGAGSGETIIDMSYWMVKSIHNFYIAHIVELGIIGLGIFLSNVAILIKDTYRGQQKSCLYGLIGNLIMGVFLDLLTTKFFWGSMILMTMVVSAERKQ